MKYLPQISYKIKNAQNFKYTDFDLNVKKNHEIFTTCKAQISPKTENAPKLLQFGTFDILNIMISTLMSKISPVKYFLLNFNFYQISINSEHFWDQFGIFFRISFRMLFPMI